MGLGMRSGDVTAAVADRWVDAWTTGDLEGVQGMLATHVTIEGNLGLSPETPALLEEIRILAAAVEEVRVLSIRLPDAPADRGHPARGVPRRARRTDRRNPLGLRPHGS